MLPRSSSSRLLGRAPELRQFIAALSRAETGLPEVMVIEAERGLGSSRLLSEMASAATAMGWTAVESDPVHLFAQRLADTCASLTGPSADNSVGLRGNPTVVFADNADDLDDESLVRLHELITRPADASAHFVVMALAFSTRERVVSLRRAAEAAGSPTLLLRPLEPKDALELAAASLGRDPSEAELSLIEHARGVPGRIVQITSTLGSDKPRRRVTSAPVPLTPFIGREAETRELLQLIPVERLITVTGPGGCGKTRLVQEVIHRLANTTALDIRWVELARRTDGPGVLNALSAALGIIEIEQSDLADHIVLALADRTDTVLVLDNAEHLLASVSDIVRRTLDASNGVRILCTSREPLDVPGELVWRVPPLSAPRAGLHRDIDSLCQFESVQLFLERAARVRRGFTITAANAAHVAAICARLDGLPLAIELAAARVRSMPPDRIAAELIHQLQSLPPVVGGTGGRHETLRSCIAWSEALLDDVDQIVFRRLGVFVGGFTLDAAQALMEAFADVDPYEVAEAIRRLVDKSLLVLDDEHDRFLMLETIRSFALERLDDFDEGPTACDAHATWFADWLGMLDRAAHAQDAQQFINQTPAWVQTIGNEIGNCYAAFNWVPAGGPVSLRLSAGLGYYWLISGSYDEAVRYGLAAIQAGDRTTVEWGDAAMWMAGVIYNASLKEGSELAETVSGSGAFLDSRVRTRLSGSMSHGEVGEHGPTPMLLQRYAELRTRSAATNDWFTFTNCSYVPASVCAEFGLLDEAESNLESFVNHRVLLVEATCALWRGQLDLASRLTAQASASVDADLNNPVAEIAEVGFVEAQISLARERSALNSSQVWQQLRGRSIGMFTDTVHFFEAFSSLSLNDDRSAVKSLLVTAKSPAKIYRAYAHLWLSRVHLALGDRAAAHESATALLNDWPHLRTPAFEAVGHLVLAECAMATDIRSGFDQAHRSLASAAEYGLWTAAVDALEAIGVLLIENHRVVDGARLLGAAHAERDRMEYRFRFAHRRTYVDAAHIVAKPTVGWAEGLTMSLVTAIELAQRMRGERGRASFGWDSLTPMEVQVVELVEAGLTNPQIADRLFVSRATVKTHLVHVYEKLGISSRAELAVRSATRVAHADAG